MSIKGKSVLLAVGALGLVLAGAGPALAQGHAGGGGHAGGHSVRRRPRCGWACGRRRTLCRAGSFRGRRPCRDGLSWRRLCAWGRLCRPRSYVGGHGYSTGWRGGAWGGWRGSAWRGGYWRGGFWPRCVLRSRDLPGSCRFCRWRTRRIGMAASPTTTPTMSITPGTRPMMATSRPIRRRWPIRVPAVQPM